MAITPLPLPSPKANEPFQEESALLPMFANPSTSDLAGSLMTNLRISRDASSQQYADAMARQQEYYNRALELQGQDSLLDAGSKYIAHPGGMTLLSGMPGFRRLVAGLPDPTWQALSQQDYNKGNAEIISKSGPGYKAFLEAGSQFSPDQIGFSTGLPRPTAVTPLQLQIEQSKEDAASARHAADGGIKLTETYGPYETPFGTTTSSASIPRGYTRQQINDAADRAGIPRKGPATPLPYNPNAPAGPQKNIPATQGAQGTPAPTASAAAVSREAAWDASRKNAPAHLKPAVDAIERARAQNGGKLVVDAQGQVIGVTPEGRRVPLGRTQ